ncbi:MAG: hypothetical protein ACXWKB_08105 [Methyloceanibacter sp.]
MKAQKRRAPPGEFAGTLENAKPATTPNFRAQSVVASVPSITVKPCNVVVGVVTTVLCFFQHTDQGRNLIQGAANKYLVQDVTNIINSQLP